MSRVRRPQVEVIGIAEQDLNAEFFEDAPTSLTASAVPTGMKTGVEIEPPGVVSLPVLAGAAYLNLIVDGHVD